MKRRNADCGKIRRPIKRNKITEGMYGSTTVLYLKFLILWAIVITADFMFMFRFEFLWPFWLLLRSVHDSFKYKGLAFSALFVCIAITSDLVCLFFIPVHWLLFAASTYVWVQYVWHTDKGICLPTIILWMLFVYLEAGIRWKDNRHLPHLDLCRPFAAHCIGYPVVTLGFGFKSYVGYRMRQRKQREVAKENEFYMQLLQQALPQDETSPSPALNTSCSDECTSTPNCQNIGIVQSNGQINSSNTLQTQQIPVENNHQNHQTSRRNSHSNNNSSIDKIATKYETHHNNVQQTSSKQNQNYHEILKNTGNSWDSTTTTMNGTTGKDHKPSTNLNNSNSENNNKKSVSTCNGNVNQYETEEPVEQTEKTKGRRNRSKKDTFSKDNHHNNSNNTNHSSHNSSHGNSDASSVSSLSSTSNNSSTTITNFASQLVKKICDTCCRLEAEVKKYRAELSHMKQIENELRQKLDSQASIKSCLQAKQKEYEELDRRLTELQNLRQLDILNIQQAEKRLLEERRLRQSVDVQLQNEKKSRKLAEDKVQAIRSECTNDQCKQRRQQIEMELKQMRRELKAVEDAKLAAEQQSRKLEQELRMFEVEIRNREAHQGTEVLMTALQAMQDKNSTLEKNLSAETRVKLDLFSALGEAKRQLEIKDNMLRSKDDEVMDLRAKIAQLLAVMPENSLCLSPPSNSGGSSMLRINDSSSAIQSGGPGSPMLTTGSMLTSGNTRGGPTAAVAQANNNSNIVNGQPQNKCLNNSLINGQQTNSNCQQQHQSQSSNLDPNALAYTPKLNNTAALCPSGSEA